MSISRLFAMAAVLLTLSAPAYAQIYYDDDPPPEVWDNVVIWGSLGFVDGTGAFGGGGGGGQVLYFETLTGQQQELLAGDPRKDVRCVQNFSSSWVSTNPSTLDRHLAARAAVLNYMSRLAYSQKQALLGKTVTVTYADNGTESWLVVNPMARYQSPTSRSQAPCRSGLARSSKGRLHVPYEIEFAWLECK
jgi:hypothetical protein